MIRCSLEKPAYKEKLRLRSYGVPDEETQVFPEIKRKVRDIMAIFLAMTVGLCCGMGGIGGMNRPSMNNTKADTSPPS